MAQQQQQDQQKSAAEIKQEQTDPNLTELKGFIDPNEELEPKGTDNPEHPIKEGKEETRK